MGFGGRSQWFVILSKKCDSMSKRVNVWGDFLKIGCKSQINDLGAMCSGLWDKIRF